MAATIRPKNITANITLKFTFIGLYLSARTRPSGDAGAAGRASGPYGGAVSGP